MKYLIFFLSLNAAYAQNPAFTRGQEDNSTVVSGTASVECGVKAEKVRFHFSPERGVFVEVADGTESPYATSTQMEGIDQHDIDFARKCWCTQFYDMSAEYCPTNFDSCQVKGPNGEVKCYALSRSESLLRGLWPIALFWYGLLLLAWFCSNRGTQARAYGYRLFCLGCKQEAREEELRQYIDDIIHNNSFKIILLRRSAMIRLERIRGLGTFPEFKWISQWFLRDDDPDIDRVLSYDRPEPEVDTVLLSMKVKSFYSSGGDDGSRSEDALELGQVSPRTKEFSTAAEGPYDEVDQFYSLRPTSSTNNTNTTATSNNKQCIVVKEEEDDYSVSDDENENACAICLKALQDGDIIGDIACGHLFHKACLKDWLKRKNSCPLCQRMDIAELKRIRSPGTKKDPRTNGDDTTNINGTPESDDNEPEPENGSEVGGGDSDGSS
mmetsp:Transcript_15570/g.20276  ORF Transcript_15570/g.20276 Transcript_15570/m.20276 type:complete len:439 (+) Transcript_15570:187-1503(+)